MQILGLGTDIVECARIEAMIQKHGAMFLERVYTQAEIDYCRPRRAAVQHYAGRWAAKEAILKAMGTGWAKGIGWTELEIVNLPGGQPEARLHGQAAALCRDRGVRQVLVSLSHCQEYATATAICLGN